MDRFSMSTEIIFGCDAIKKLSKVLKELGSLKVFIVTGKNFARKSGLLKSLTMDLDENKIESFVFAEVEPEPESDFIDNAVEEFKNSECDCIVALGGGSVIDVSKYIAMMATNGGKCTEYEYGKKIENHCVDLVAVPTTTGTGSEVTQYSVINNSQTGRKFTIASEILKPKYAIIDPLISLSMPKSVLISTALDAWTHSIEGFLNDNSNVIMNPLAKESIEIIGKDLPEAIIDTTNSDIRKNLSLASLMGGLVISEVRTGMVHTMSVALAKVTGLPHGMLNAIIVPYVLDFNKDFYNIKLIEVAKLMGGESVDNEEQAVEYIKDWLGALGVESGLKRFNIDEDSIEFLVERVKQDKGLKLVNPRKFDDKDLEAIFIEILKG